ncbi:MAG: DUF393 domain-containing protein [Burkholderiales bacterium]|nr:DUF393 domain-containing protein [Burkholderiales bacterium]
MTDIFPLTLYFDGSCILCRAEMENLRQRDARGLLRFIDISPRDFERTPVGVTRDDLMARIHATRADGGLVVGVDVFRLAYRAVGLGWVARITEWPGLRALAEGLYPWLARYRHRLPRRLLAGAFDLLGRGAARRAAARRCGATGACERRDFSSDRRQS